jgi:cytochrome c biogenesis protein CcdA
LEDIECSTNGSDSCNEFLEKDTLVDAIPEEDSFFKFLIILFPAALSDSINPCAFAVLFILLSSILSKFQSYRKAIFSGLLFSLAIFISYFLM